MFDTACYIAKAGLGSKLLTISQLEGIVKSWFIGLVSDESYSAENTKETYDHMYNCILQVRYIALIVKINDSNSFNPKVMIAAAALGEFLIQAIIDVYIKLPSRHLLI